MTCKSKFSCFSRWVNYWNMKGWISLEDQTKGMWGRWGHTMCIFSISLRRVIWTSSGERVCYFVISIPCSNIFCVNYMSSSVGSVLSSLCMCVLGWAWALLQFYPFYQFSDFANVSNTCFLLKTMPCIQDICIYVKPNCLWWDNLRARVNDLDPFRSLKQITY